MPKIITVNTNAFPRFQFMTWHAYFENNEEERGYGPTEEDAITDLVNTYLQAE